MMSFYSDHQQPQDRRPKQLPYMKTTGTNLNMTSEQESHTSGLSNPTSMNLTEKVSHQTTNKYLNRQTKNQQHQDCSQSTPVTMNQHSTTHQQLSKDLHHQPHQTPATHTIEEDPESYYHQTHTALALLLLARSNNRPQQIWQLRLLQLQQLRLLSNQMDHLQPLPLHRLPPRLDNKLQAVHRLLYGEPLEALEDLAALGTLMDLVD
jgi:hypothetical protein